MYTLLKLEIQTKPLHKVRFIWEVAYVGMWPPGKAQEYLDRLVERESGSCRGSSAAFRLMMNPARMEPHPIWRTAF